MLSVGDAEETVDKIDNAGSIFLGNLSSRVPGISRNKPHTVTRKNKACGGLSLESFMHTITPEDLRKDCFLPEMLLR